MNQPQKLLFDAPIPSIVPVKGSEAGYPVHRIFCVGRNYAAHAAEMGHEVDRETPFYFTKSPSTIVQNGMTIPYPPGTENYHFEMELVVAIGAPAFKVAVEDAMKCVFGYATGLDMTRRDLQLTAREKGRPWSLGKDFEQSAVISEISRVDEFGSIENQRIDLQVDGEIRQEARLSDLVWKVPELISHLSGYYHLQPGDLMYTGTPAGVGAVGPGAELFGTIEGLAPVCLSLSEAEA
jgi:fumarylpyruvate hydrolase